MHLAPQVTLHGSLGFLADGLPGVWQTVSHMRRLVREYRTDGRMRRAAVNILFLTPDRGGVSRPRALFEWVRDHVRYIPDVHEVETLATPVKTLESLFGDCDDQATLLATLFEAVGYATRFVVAAYNDPATMEHVYLQVMVDGIWFDCDPTEPQPFGWEPPGAVAIHYERA